MKSARVIGSFIDKQLLEGPAGGDPLEQGLLDSLAVEQLIAFIEEHFAIRFLDEELIPENFAKVEILGALVDRKKSPGVNT